MNRHLRLVVGVGVVLLIIIGGGLFLSTRSSPPATSNGSVMAQYYCPMHPTYTSDRPGDCPICNMKLVKKERDQQSAISAEGGSASGGSNQQTTKNLQSICYLHNCSKRHEGKPCPMTVVAKPGERVTCPICGTHIAEAATPSGQRKILYWTDPMIPGYRAEGPGKSPMGMDLVPVYEEATQTTSNEPFPEGYTPVLLSPQKQQLIGVKTAPVIRRALSKTIRTVGVIAHDPELYQAQQEFLQAQEGLRAARQGQLPSAIDQAQQLLESSRLRLRHMGLSEDMLDELSTWTGPDHRLLLGGSGQYWVYASVYEYELPLIRLGQAARVEVVAFPGRQFPGTVKAIDPMLDPMTRTVRARIVVEDPEGILKPEMYVNVSIVADLGEVLAVPEEAVFATGTQHIVFVDQGQGVFEPRAVTVGAKADGAYELLAGVSEGEPVVTSGNFLIDSESRLKAALQGAGDGMHQHGQ